MLHWSPLLILIIGLFECSAIKKEVKVSKNEEINKPQNMKKLTLSQSWGYCFLFVTIINIMAANGAFLYKFLKFPWFRILILSLMSFSVGVLCANSIVNLIPIGFGLVPDQLPELSKRTWIFKSSTILFGLLSLAIVETLIKVFILYRQRKRGVMVSSFKCDHNHGNGESGTQNLIENNGGVVARESNDYSTADLEEDGNKHTHVPHGPFYSLICLRQTTPSFAMLIIVGDAIHNLIDGLAIGSTFAISFEQGINMFISILSEELPHELGDFAALLAAGFSVKQALFWNLVSSLSCYLGMVIGLILGPLQYVAPYIEVYCGGLFIYISFVALYPEVMEEAEKNAEGVFGRYLRNLAIVYVSIFIGMVFIVGLANVNIHVPM